jgi:2,3-bisphosphoglycerate-dependent phosphoglycerate mutase
MPRLISAIIRHGDYHQLVDTPSALQPFPLTEQGRHQASACAGSLLEIAETRGWAIAETAYSSLQLRAWQTADILIQEINSRSSNPVQLHSHEALAERSVGSAANLTHHQIKDIIDQDPRFPELPENWKADSHFKLPLQGAESLMQAGERVAQFLQSQTLRLHSEISSDTLALFIGHGASFRHAAHILGILDYDDIQRLSMYHASPVYLEVTPEGDWRHIAGEWKVRSRDERPMD